jgi:hypothetical protein
LTWLDKFLTGGVTIYSGRNLSVTLYGDIACGFAEDMLEKGLESSVVAVFAGMRVESTHSG